MGKLSLLDCTLRDGGYVNEWMFGEETIKGFNRKIAQTGVEILEVGFIKGNTYNKNCTVFPDIQSITQMIQPKAPKMMYVGMIDMSAPVPIERIIPRNEDTIDGIRVIFKKEKIEEAYDYCKKVQALGYTLFVQFVGTDSYSDREFIDAIEKFNCIMPYSVSIVDTFGMIKRKQFLRLVYMADNNLAKGIVLGYHAHNNLQQAFGNAEALVELNLQRDLCIDACVFGMGRGAGNLNLELFAEYMNENYGTQYQIEPMLEIMDEYLNDIYRERFWGYSLPLYLSATTGCHPNYAIYLAEKNALTEKSFHELLRGIPDELKAKFSKENAERIYKEYQDKFVDDRVAIRELSESLQDKTVLLLAPGRTLIEYKEMIQKKVEELQPTVLAVNHINKVFDADYIFSSNMRRYVKIQGKTGSKCIITSNVKEAEVYDYMVNFASFSSEYPEVIDNSGLMALKLLSRVGVKKVLIAGMDGYSAGNDYADSSLDYDFSDVAESRNGLIAKEISAMMAKMDISFLTPTKYIIKTDEVKKVQ